LRRYPEVLPVEEFGPVFHPLVPIGKEIPRSGRDKTVAESRGEAGGCSAADRLRNGAVAPDVRRTRYAGQGLPSEV
jgi:hypothetical protein